MNDPYGLGNPPPSGQPSPGQVYQPYGQPGQPYGQPGQPYGHPLGQLPSQPTYGYGPQGNPPPDPQSYVSYGQGAAPAGIYTPPVNVQSNELRQLDDDAQLWLLVGAAGFWFGFGWVTGPLAWYYGSQIRGKYRALGHHPGSSANWARGIGIASTLIYALGIAAFVSILSLMIAGAALL